MSFDFKSVIGMIAPIIFSLIPVLRPFQLTITTAMAEAEALFAATQGAEKKAHVLAIVQAAAEAVNVAKPGAIQIAAIVSAADNGIDAAIAASHAFAKAPVVTAAKPATA